MSTALAPGSTFVGFRIEEVVGRGGMGVVYKAYDPALERPVALKLIAPELAADERFRSRFLRESRLAAGLGHPHVLPIYSAGEESGQLYLAMRFVEGEDLRSLLAREGTLSPERALRIIGQIGDALDAAHAKGLVHRDLKPANVLLDKAGEAYLSDFGLAKQLGSASTQTGHLVGTLHYLAPEQIRGEAVDARTDCYALACVLYECLAGASPFAGQTEAETLWAHMQEEPPPLAGYPELDPVFRKALAKEKDARYPSCGAFLAAAHSALGIEAPAVRRRRRRRARGLLLAGAALLAVAIAVSLGLALAGGADELAPLGNGVAAIPVDGDAVGRFIELGAAPGNVAVGEGGVWIVNADGRTVSRIDPESGEVVSTFETGSVPSDIAAGGGAVWVGNGEGVDANWTVSLSRVSAESTETTRTVALPDEMTAPGNPSTGIPGLAVGRGAVWALNPDGSVSRFDAKTGELLATIDTWARISIAAGMEGIWTIDPDGVLVPGEASISRISPRTNRVVQTIPLRASFLSGIAVGAGSVWALAPDEGVVWRVEPGRRPVARTIDVGGSPGLGFTAFGDGALWVAGDDLVRIDPETNAIAARIRLEGVAQALAAGVGSAWVSIAGATRERTLPASVCGSVEAGGRDYDVLIASDLPLQGPYGVGPRAMADAVRHVLRRRSFQAGRFAVGYQSCDNSTVQTGNWEIRRCVANGKAYAAADDLVAVIGPVHSDCAKAELPTLNAADGPLALISPSNTHPDLTRAGAPVPYALRGAPDVYYPTGERNFLRLPARDDLQGVALALLAKQLKLRNVFLFYDDPAPKFLLVESFRRASRRLGVGVAGMSPFRAGAKSYAALAARVARSGADGVVLAGHPQFGGAEMLRAIRARLGSIPVMTSFDVWQPISDIAGSLGQDAVGLYLSTPELPPSAFDPSPASQQLLRELGAIDTPLTWVPHAAQAAEIVLDAIARSDGTRASVLQELRKTVVTDGLLGSFRFDRYGDVTPARIMILRIPRKTPAGVALYVNQRGAVIDRVLTIPSDLAS